MIFESWSSEELLAFFMVFVRISSLFMVLPIFSDKSLPSMVKVFLSLTFSAILFPALKAAGLVPFNLVSVWSESVSGLLTTLTAEIVVGLVVGFAAQLVFYSIHIAGDLISQLMGFNMASSYDPHLEMQSQTIGQMLSALAILAFLAVDGHHVLIKAMMETFSTIPMGHYGFHEGFKNAIISMTTHTLAYGVQLAAPMAACMLLVNIIYGILGKALPQLNLLSLSLASGALMGGVILMFTYPSIQNGMVSLYETSFEGLKNLMVVYGGK